ncbi:MULTISPECIES: barstar family protein [Xanthomonas]|uniref:Barnase inhibitor n=1 Tax=Xanthomonas cucurbitae TaxID=56453 RepID=A0A2S7DSC1_9XANT|nr:barstar family protein [Xanthomonas cucurbitae]PPU76733.1 barnase inhibitor [Xanthomonas cucurbitae]QHG87297.1 barnase inhibitor [Xanthomonas cucurbitae]WDM69603.1 barstar family protein [Xanthomonas cucurbitae]WDM73477.1 barstar family protein [Xanthomonas cucurbitae]WDM73881.1 barstar family protein [Xanthomonas cucurbitae]
MSAGDFALDLSDPQQSGVYQADTDDLDTMAALARDAGLRILRVDLATCNDKRMLLMRLATQLDFPAGFGRNWDALSDGLRDLSWLAAPRGYALLIDGADALAKAVPGDRDTLLDILDEAATSWAARGRTFAAFVAPAGACS